MSFILDSVVYKVWCEWDINQEYYLFKTYEDAAKWTEYQLDSMECLDGGSFKELEDEGLVGIDAINIMAGEE